MMKHLISLIAVMCCINITLAKTTLQLQSDNRVLVNPGRTLAQSSHLFYLTPRTHQELHHAIQVGNGLGKLRQFKLGSKEFLLTAPVHREIEGVGRPDVFINEIIAENKFHSYVIRLEIFEDLLNGALCRGEPVHFFVPKPKGEIITQGDEVEDDMKIQGDGVHNSQITRGDDAEEDIGPVTRKRTVAINPQQLHTSGTEERDTNTNTNTPPKKSQTSGAEEEDTSRSSRGSTTKAYGEYYNMGMDEQYYDGFSTGQAMYSVYPKKEQGAVDYFDSAFLVKMMVVVALMGFTFCGGVLCTVCGFGVMYAGQQAQKRNMRIDDIEMDP
eukprot:660968_1